MVIQYASLRSGISPAGACYMPPSSTASPSTQPMSGPTSDIRQINKVAVLGAGTMGSRIAAHIANAGLPVVLLDIVPPGTDADAPKPERNKIVLAALDGLKKSKPAAFYSPDSARLITIGNFDDDLALIADCDWIIEVVAENLEIKRALLNKVAAASPRRLHPHQQHQRPAHPRDRRRHAHGAAPPLVRHALLQSAALHAAARDHPHARLRSRRHRCRRALLRPAPRQGHRPRARHAELHRQPHRHLLHEQRHPPHAGAGPHHRRGRHAHRRRARLAQDRHLPPRRHGRRRRHGARGKELLRAGRKDRRRARRRGARPLHRQDAREQMARRQDETGLLQERGQGRRRPRPAPRPRLADARLQAQHAAQISRDRDGEERRAHRLLALRSFSTAMRARTKLLPSTGRSSPSSSPTAPTASPKSPTTSSRSIRP